MHFCCCRQIDECLSCRGFALSSQQGHQALHFRVDTPEDRAQAHQIDTHIHVVGRSVVYIQVAHMLGIDSPVMRSPAVAQAQVSQRFHQTSDGH